MGKHKANAQTAGGGGGLVAAYHEERTAAKVKGGLLLGTIQMEEVDARTLSGTSVFDPVLCEFAYRWFCPPKGMVLDPFAGGSVRGIVASMLGRRYVGIDLRPEQVAANRAQAEKLCSKPLPIWHVGDSLELQKIAGSVKADFLFSCPPYADLERYSEDPRDLSNMDYDEFLAAYRKIIAAGAAQLKDDRFACFVVGDVRDGDGLYRGFPAHTVQAFVDAGLRLYNDAVLVTMVGSLPVRTGKQFETSRKLGKTHQNVLVFVKGDPRKATAACGKVEFGDIGAEQAEADPLETDEDENPGGGFQPFSTSGLGLQQNPIQPPRREAFSRLEKGAREFGEPL